MKEWRHDELQHDLAAHLMRPERMLWEDTQLGPSGSPRPDVYTMRKSYTKPHPLVYEIKVSVSDFRSDITSGKWHKYLDFACGVYFACPKGMITKADLPKGCGLIVRGEEKWRALKAPTIERCELDWIVMMKLLIDGIERYSPERRLKHYTKYIRSKEAAAELGQDVADAVTDLQRVRDRVVSLERKMEFDSKDSTERASRIVKSAEDTARDIKTNAAGVNKNVYEFLGLEPGANLFSMNSKLSQMKASLSADEMVSAMRRGLQQMERQLSIMGKVVGKNDLLNSYIVPS